jgi:HD-like signal output (HDOD) protein
VPSFRERLSALLERSRDLPTLPEVVHETVPAGAVVGIIERDAALAARLLHAANSPFYLLGGASIDSVPAVVSRLGPGRLRALCLALGAERAFGAGGGGTLDYRAFWIHSAAVGMTANRLWELAGGTGPLGADGMLAAGLMHDIGILVLDQHFPAELRAAQSIAERDGTPLWRAEGSVLGMDHGEVGALLLGRWKLSAPACAAVANHHHPDASAEVADRSAARCLHAAEAVCGGVALGSGIEGPPDLEPPDALARVGLMYEKRVAFGTALEQVRASAAAFIAPS